MLVASALATGYAMSMQGPPDFGNPELEPTDEQLAALSREAFADVTERHREALVRLRAHVAGLRTLALARLDERVASSQGSR